MNKLNVFEEIKNIYAANKKNAEDRALNYLNIANRSALFLENEDKISDLKLKIARFEVLNDLTNAAQTKKELDSRLNERNKILKSLNLSKDDLIAKYTCEKCHDSGFTENGVCPCCKNIYHNVVLKILKLDNQKLKSFDNSIKSTSEDLTKLYNSCKIYVEKFPSKKKNLVFQGQTGCGKSFTASCIANEIYKKGFNVIFISSFEMNNLFKEQHHSFENLKTDYLSFFIDADLLIIDDLGGEAIFKNITIEYLLNLLDSRIEQGKNTIITTNLEFDSIKNIYGDRIFYRIANEHDSNCYRFPDFNFRKKEK